MEVWIMILLIVIVVLLYIIALGVAPEQLKAAREGALGFVVIGVLVFLVLLVYERLGGTF